MHAVQFNVMTSLPHRVASSPLTAMLFAALFCAAAWTPADAVTLRVPSEYPTIASALEASSSGDSVVVACGVYFESYLQLSPGITVCSENGDPTCVTVDAQSHGGFVGHSLLEPTVLSGITIRNAAEGGGAALRCITDCVVRVVNCVFLDGRATDGAGAGIAFDCAVEFLDCTFRGNRVDEGEHHRGGAIYVNASRVRLEGCLFEQNGAERGGALFSFNGGQAEMLDCRFIGNDAIKGGAISLEGQSNLTVQDGLFIGNTSNSGGAVSLEEGSGLVIHGGTFESNVALDSETATGTGGAITARLGTSVQVTAGTFIGNSAGNGGSVAALGVSRLELFDCSFLHNEAEYAGALNVSGCPFSIRRVLFWDNVATQGNGGAILLVGASGTTESCTFHANSAAGAGGALFAGGSPTAVEVASCILTENFSTAVVSCGEEVQMTPRCCDLFGNAGGDWIGCWDGLDGLDGNLSSDPRFCDPGIGDFELRTDSPCAPDGHPLCGVIGAFPVGCGPVSVKRASWGTIKALYR